MKMNCLMFESSIPLLRLLYLSHTHTHTQWEWQAAPPLTHPCVHNNKRTLTMVIEQLEASFVRRRGTRFWGSGIAREDAYNLENLKTIETKGRITTLYIMLEAAKAEVMKKVEGCNKQVRACSSRLREKGCSRIERISNKQEGRRDFLIANTFVVWIANSRSRIIMISTNLAVNDVDARREWSREASTTLSS
jgi:hypothetical protein